ncbi:MAG: hypothetical protein HEQ19_30685 [Gloeotrichia echinulata CP02]
MSKTSSLSRNISIDAVKRFWIWDLGFWIDPDHKGQTILDLGFGILD